MQKHEVKIGQLVEGEAQRDAIHFAVIPLVAAEYLSVGQRVQLDMNGKAIAYRRRVVGIVDPFLEEGVEPGQTFWCLLMPNTITSLRHDWEHPAFPRVAPAARTEASADSKEASRQWLKDYLETTDAPDYDTVVKVIRGSLEGKEVDLYGYGKSGFRDYGGDKAYLLFIGTDAHSEIPAEFWTHLEVAEGIVVPAKLRAESFSCSC